MRPPGAAILCYHGVTGTALPSASVANIPLPEITATLERFRADREILPLSELLLRKASGASVAGLAALTFDDAYASLADLLGPWLRQEGIPYSVFVTTHACRTGARLWWDRIDDLFPQAGPERWRAFEDELGLPESYRVGQPKEFGPLRPLRQYILSRFQGRWPAELESQLARMETTLGSATIQRAMTFEELDQLITSGGVEIGVHTCTHPVLPLLPDDELLSEIHASLHELRERYRETIPVLALPFGLFDARTLRLASEAGVSASLTLANRLMTGESTLGTPRFSMTRGVPIWKRRLHWLGVAQTVRRVLRLGHSGYAYPALPSAVS